MNRAPLLLVPVGMMAFAMACGPQVWSFDYLDAASNAASSSLSSESGQAIALDGGADASGDGAPAGDAGLEGGPLLSGCPSGSGFECTVCGDSGACRKSANTPVCGAEKRCVECTGRENGCPLDAGPRVCVDEHCVAACSNDGDCRSNSGLCIRASGSDAGYCAQCGNLGCATSSEPQCSNASICVECTNSGPPGQCGFGVCSPNGYCTGLN